MQQILSNETYTGRYAMAKTVQRTYQGKGRTYLPEDKWAVFEDHHPAIVSKEDFELVKAKKQKKGKRGKNPPNILRNKIYCARCGAHMGIPDSAAKTPKYMCRTNWYYGGGCDAACVEKSTVYDAVFHAVKDVTKAFLDEGGVAEGFEKQKKDRLSAEEHYRRELARKNSELRSLEGKKASLYGDFCSGLLDEKEYLTLNGQCTEKMKTAAETLSALSDLLEKERKKSDDMDTVSSRLARFRGKRKLSQEMADALIEKVAVHDADRIEVIFRFDDELRALAAGRQDGREGMAYAGQDRVLHPPFAV